MQGLQGGPTRAQVRHAACGVAADALPGAGVGHQVCRPALDWAHDVIGGTPVRLPLPAVRAAAGVGLCPVSQLSQGKHRVPQRPQHCMGKVGLMLVI